MTVRPLLPSETEEAVALAARAFHDDPLFAHVYPVAASRGRRFQLEHRAALRHVYFPLGIPEAVDLGGRLAGVALWRPDGDRTPWWRELLMAPALVRAVGLTNWAVALEAFVVSEAMLPEGTYHCLGMMAVAPEHQGRGLGKALLRAGLDRADADGRGCFLQTSVEGNVGFYRRHGFRVTAEAAVPDGPRLWGMWRNPRARG